MTQPKHLTQEADIGSGEKNPGQQETEKMIEKVPPNKPEKPTNAFNSPGEPSQKNNNAQSGNPP